MIFQQKYDYCDDLYVSFQDPLEFPAHELEKYFKVGDHVKVIKGRFEGDTGLIVRVEEDLIVLFSDLTFHEVSKICDRLIENTSSVNIILNIGAKDQYERSSLESRCLILYVLQPAHGCVI